MALHVPPHRTAWSWLTVALAATLASCGAPRQSMNMAPSLIATPPHRMARTDYPFDASGKYIDAWAAAGATRYGRFINTDRTEDGRTDTAAPERRPLPPARATTPKKAAPPKATASKPPAKKPTVKKPTAKKPTPPRATSHTVKRGDTLSSISRRYGVSVTALKRANNLKTDRIVNGRKLKIPSR